MAQAIIAGLIVAVIVTAGAVFRKRLARFWQRRHPIEVTATRIVNEEWTLALSGALPSEIAALTGDIPSREMYGRLQEAGAVDCLETRVRISMRGLSDEGAVIRNLRARVDRSLPLAGTRVYNATAGANSATLLVIDLDKDNSPAFEWYEDGAREPKGDSPYFNTHTVFLDKGEVQDLIVIGQAKNSFARWHLVLELTVGEHRTSIRVDDGGKPFKTSGDPAGGFLEKLEWAWDLRGGFITERVWDNGG
jgi:hypothetical protein